MKDITVLDEETGITFTYKWRDAYGWCVSFCDKAYRSDTSLFRIAMKNCREHWPKLPDELKEEIDKHNKDLQEVCKRLGSK